MDAVKAIKDIYSIEEFKEIADHGCQSGVCRQHIYYGDTVRFYETFEDSILEYFDNEGLGTEFLVNLFENANADLTVYKNHVCWAFIEYVAMEAVAEHNHEYADANLEPVDTNMYHTENGELVYN